MKDNCVFFTCSKLMHFYHSQDYFRNLHVFTVVYNMAVVCTLICVSHFPTYRLHSETYSTKDISIPRRLFR
jgi:hypothetical protein